ncbi:MAG: acetylornithine deacetylase [Gammaproteobacteria bacterium]
MTPSLPSLESMIRRLVAIPSVSSPRRDLDQGNRAVCEAVGEWMEHLGLSVQIRPLPGAGHKFNLIARAGGDADDGLVLSGHTDTVPWDDGAWRLDPFEGVVRDGRLYGLGSADMKSFFAVVAHALRRLDLDRLRRPLVVLATADEESGMAGARALADAGQRPGARVIIGEPTGLVPVNRHKGILMEQVRLQGRSGHSSDPAAGLNAIDGMGEVVRALQDFRRDIAGRFRDEAFAVPEATLNFGRIEGGDSPNRICGSCTLSLDLRTPPGGRVSALREELRRAVCQRLENSGFRIGFDALFEGVDPLEPGETDVLARACAEAAGHACAAVSFGTEGPFFRRLGMEVVILGPGDIAVAHQPDESIELAEAERAVDLLAGLVHRFCIDGS